MIQSHQDYRSVCAGCAFWSEPGGKCGGVWYQIWIWLWSVFPHWITNNEPIANFLPGIRCCRVLRVFFSPSGCGGIWSSVSLKCIFISFLCEEGEQEDPFLILRDTDDPVPQRTSILPLFNTSKGACGTCRGCWVLPRSERGRKEEIFWAALPKAFLFRPKQHSELQIIFTFSKKLELPVCFPRALQSH